MQTLNEKPPEVKWPNYSGIFEHTQVYDSSYQKWKKDQKYEGKFFGESFHGEGTYQWNFLCSRTVYEGLFYSNHKEGYANVSLPNNFVFEGLFINNKPFGPGILTYPNGRQDVGFWMGTKLVRLGRSVDYIIPRLAPSPSAKIKLLQFRRLIPLNEITSDSATNILEEYNYTDQMRTPYSSFIYDPRSLFFYKPMFEKMYFVNSVSKGFHSESSNLDLILRSGDFDLYTGDENVDEISLRKIPSHCLCRDGALLVKYDTGSNEVDYCNENFLKNEFPIGLLSYYTKYGTLEGLNEANPQLEESLKEVFPEELMEEEINELNTFPSQIVSWNRSELCIEILKQIFRFRTFEEKLTFKIAKLMLGVRNAFRKTGEMERQCLQFLKMCSMGPSYVIKEFLCNYNISEELTDARGNNGIMFAASADQEDLIDILADYGVDVDNFNDEGLTPLNLCLLRKLAQIHKISNWEVAFLPPEVNLPPGENIPSEEWRPRESIPSLDRIFGDGMSIDDTKPGTIEDTDSMKVTSDTKIDQQLFLSDDFLDILSEVTILNYKSDPGSCHSEENQSPDGISSAPGNIDPTPKVTKKFVPKSLKRDEYEKSVKKESTDKYLFGFEVQPRPSVDLEKKIETKKSSKAKMGRKESIKTVERSIVLEYPPDPDTLKKLSEIDRTIEKLLKRGADPDKSEVPKPAIHLGVYTKDVKIVKLLLQYGASPNTKLYPNEGLLTPLHVLVLLKPDPEYIEICNTLLFSGANPEEETTPDFYITEDEKGILDCEQGRTPLHLLCMRPDLEWVDPDEYLKAIGLQLAGISDPKHFYCGHSCLTLCMMTGNINFLKTLLESDIFDPNEVLGNDLGTSLHVLVSTKLQVKTPYDSSIKMCDLLLDHGADPLMKFTKPKKLVGTCVQYGYREIDAETQKRKNEQSGKKESRGSRPDKNVRDYLKDHIRVVEYLEKRANELKSSRDNENLTSLEDEEDGGLSGKNKYTKGSDEMDMDNLISDESKIQKKKGEGEDDDSIDSKEKKGKKGKKGRDITALDDGDDDRKDLEDNKKKRKGKADGDFETDSQSLSEDKKKKKKDGKKKKSKTVLKDKVKDKDKDKDKKQKDLKKKLTKTDLSEKLKRTESSAADKANLSKCSKLTVREEEKPQPKCSERFPEKIRQTLLEMYWKCPNIDINELLLPYVVLRNGDLYYRFKGAKPLLREQYSMV